MPSTLTASRRAPSNLGDRGRTTRIPDEVRSVILAYVRASGRSAGRRSMCGGCAKLRVTRRSWWTARLPVPSWGHGAAATQGPISPSGHFIRYRPSIACFFVPYGGHGGLPARSWSRSGCAGPAEKGGTRRTPRLAQASARLRAGVDCGVHPSGHGGRVVAIRGNAEIIRAYIPPPLLPRVSPRAGANRRSLPSVSQWI